MWFEVEAPSKRLTGVKEIIFWAESGAENPKMTGSSHIILCS